jgi:hypothetical protein
MEFWLLGAGAIILIAITVWIVWPGQSTDAALDSASHIEEERVMTDNPPSAQDSGVQVRDSARTGGSGEPWSSPTIAREGVSTTPATSGSQPGEATGVTAGTQPEATGASLAPPTGGYRGSAISPLAQPRVLSIGAGALLCAGGAIGGAWLYARWQRERNRPINRLRRGARDVASRLGDRLPDVAGRFPEVAGRLGERLPEIATRLGERMPDVDDLPSGTAPVGGAATAILLSALVASRAMRRGSQAQPSEEMRAQAREVVSQMLVEALGRGRQAMDLGQALAGQTRERARTEMLARLADKRASERQQSGQKYHETRAAGPFLGLGFGRLALVAGGSYLVWRVLRGRNTQAFS